MGVEPELDGTGGEVPLNAPIAPGADPAYFRK